MGRGYKMRDLEWEYADSEVPESIIKQIGLQLGFNLPQDYIECVKINDGASVFPEEFSVGKVERCFGSLFSFDKESSEYIVKRATYIVPFLPRTVLPIANDLSGNLICLDYNDNESPIKALIQRESKKYGCDINITAILQYPLLNIRPKTQTKISAKKTIEPLRSTRVLSNMSL
jgi:hypothetical protein